MNEPDDAGEFHWLLGVIHNINVGLVVIDVDYNIKLWNNFMVNRSGKRADVAMGANIFDLFPEVSSSWFIRKIESVITLANRAFTTWEQRPYLFKFKNYRPITGTAEFMYQNITFLPLKGIDGKVNNIAIVIYDVTEAAVGKEALEEAKSRASGLTNTARKSLFEELKKNFADKSRKVLATSVDDVETLTEASETYPKIGRLLEGIKRGSRGKDFKGFKARLIGKFPANLKRLIVREFADKPELDQVKEIHSVVRGIIASLRSLQL